MIVNLTQKEFNQYVELSRRLLNRYEQPEYKVGDWVWVSHFLYLIKDYEVSIFKGLPVNSENLYTLHVENISRKATDEEVFKALIEYAKPRYERGMKIYKESKNEAIRCNGLFYYDFNMLHGGQSIPLFNIETGWAKIITPDYTNSLREVFYYGDSICHVNKKKLRICTDVLVKGEDYNETERYTEAMTKESAEKWVEDHKPRYKTGSHYWVKRIKESDFVPALYVFGEWSFCGWESTEEVFEVGNKIEFN